MRDTWVDLDVGDEDLGVSEPVGDDTSVFHRAVTSANRSANSNVIRRADLDAHRRADRDANRRADLHANRRGDLRRADTAEPTMVFARPSSMYPLASADHDASARCLSDFDATTPPLTLEEPSFDAEAIVHRFDTVPPVNAHTRVVMRPRLVKSAVPPMIRIERMSRRAG